MADQNVGEVFISLGITPEMIQRLLDTVKTATTQAGASNQVVINMTVNNNAAKETAEKAVKEVKAAAEASAPPEIPVVVQTAEALYRLYKLNKEVTDFEALRPDLEVKVDAAPAVGGLNAVGVAATQTQERGLAMGHDISHTLEIVGTAAQRLRAGLAEISGTIRGTIDEAKTAAGEDEKAFERLRLVLGETAKEGKEFVEFTAKARQGLTEAQIAKATTDFFNMGKAMGYTSQEAIESSKKFVNLSADISKVNSKPFEEVIGALRTQLLRGGNGASEYGIRIKEIDVQNEAARLSTHSLEEAFSQEELAVARTNLIMKQAVDIHAQAEAKANTFAGSQAVLKAQTEELYVALGKTAIIMGGPFLKALISLVKGAKDFIDAHPGVSKGLIAIAGAASFAIAALTGFAIFVEITSSIVAGVKGIGTAWAWLTGQTLTATGAAGAHAGALAVEAGAAEIAAKGTEAQAGALLEEKAAAQWAATEAYLHSEALWDNALAANGDVAAQDRLTAAYARQAATAEGAAATTTTASGSTAASGGIIATVLGKLGSAFGWLLGIASGTGAAAVGAAGALIILAAAVGSLIGWVIRLGLEWIGLYGYLEKAAAWLTFNSQKSLELASATQALAKANATAADAAAVNADSIQALIKAKKLDADWTEILTKQATADIALIRQHSKTVDEAAARIANYNRFLAEGFTTGEAFAQSMNKLSRLAALQDVKRTGKLSSDQAEELKTIADGLSQEDRLRAGIITKQEAEVATEESKRKQLERQKALQEELKNLEKERADLANKRSEMEIKETENVQDRLRKEIDLILNKAGAQKAEAKEKIGDPFSHTQAGQEIDTAVDAKAAEEIELKKREYLDQTAERAKKLQEDQRKETLASLAEIQKAEGAIRIEIAKNKSAYEGELQTLKEGEDELITKTRQKFAEDYQEAQKKGESDKALASIRKAAIDEEQGIHRRYTLEREKAAIHEGKVREDAIKAATRAANEAEIGLADARAKAENSLSGELEALKRREDEELKQARERKAEVGELAELKRKFAAEELKLIEANIRKLDEERKAGSKTLDDLLKAQQNAADKRNGKGAEVGVRETGQKLEGELKNVHTKDDAEQFKKLSAGAFKAEKEQQQGDVDKLFEEATKASDEFEKKASAPASKGGYAKTKQGREQKSADQADVQEKADKYNKAQDAFAAAQTKANELQKQINVKADIAAKLKEEEAKAAERLKGRAEKEGKDAAKDGPVIGVKKDADGKPLPVDGGAADADPVKTALGKVSDAIKGLPDTVQQIISATTDLISATAVLPQLTAAINSLVTGQSAFFQGLTDFGTSVVAQITNQQAQLTTMTAQVAANAAAIAALNKSSPNSNQSTAAGLGE